MYSRTRGVGAKPPATAGSQGLGDRPPHPSLPSEGEALATSLLLLLDDIAGALDDTAALSKAAVSKTAGVIGDDLALNAKQVAGLAGARELPVVWAVAKGSAINKLILVPAAFLLGWLAPWLVAPLLVLGGLYLCFEGAEKILHGRDHGKHGDAGHGGASHSPHGHGHDSGPTHATATTAAEAAITSPVDVAEEKSRIAGAIRTDFILSAEIVVITLGLVAGSPPGLRLAVLTAVAAVMTVGVYGLVAAIVKLDDLGAWLAAREQPAARGLGRAILVAAPALMRFLAFAGTAAMFLVGGGMLLHQIPVLHDRVHDLVGLIGGHDAPWLQAVTQYAAEGITGLIAGCLAVLLATLIRRTITALSR